LRQRQNGLKGKSKKSDNDKTAKTAKKSDKTAKRQIKKKFFDTIQE
jgi:hypothetical protein